MTLLDAVYPNFPKDRRLKETKDSLIWYKIVLSQNLLYVPTSRILRSNPRELDNYIEAVTAFAKTDLQNYDGYKWEDEDLHLYQFHDEGCLEGIQIINSVMNAQEQSKRYIACDIETKRVEWEDNILLSIGFATDSSTCYALYNIPIQCSRSNCTEMPEIANALQQLFDRTDIKWIWQNGKFDCTRLKYMCNIDARVDEDTLLLHYIGINERRGTHGLKNLGQLYLQAPAWDDELDQIKTSYCRKNKLRLRDFTYDLLPIETLIPYMQKDCIATYRLLFKFRTLQRPETEFIYRKLVEASGKYGQMELNGFRVDEEYLEDLEYFLDLILEDAQTELDKVSEQLWDPATYSKDTGARVKLTDTFNPKSPKQLKWMLEKATQQPVPNTSAQTIEELYRLVDKGIIKYPLAKEFIESVSTVRKASKYMDTFVQGMRDNLCRDLRVRSTINLHGTETGRLSSSNPNIQNIPRNKYIKNLFVAETGKVLLQFDYSQAELRVLALLSGDPWLIGVYQDGRDLHDTVAESMFGPDFDKEQRNMAKTINFGIAYGRGPSSISEAFGKSMFESKAIIDKWFKPMPKVKEYINGRRRAANRGEQCTTPLGRERHFVLTDAEKNHIQNEYINTPIQSLASDFTMISLLCIHDYLVQEHLQNDAKIIMTVHDSIILEVTDDAELIDKLVRNGVRIMAEVPQQLIPDCPVPFKADADVGTKWGEMEEYVCE